jgi:NAD(P)-dependent dehydrogenase (short-subunit alcohol dehydrogenase family)
MWALSRLQRWVGASVVLFSTVALGTGMPYHVSVASAEGVVEGLARALAAGLAAPRVRVNAVAPSVTDTPSAERLMSGEEKRKAAAERHPSKRVMTAVELARSVGRPLDDAPWVTGQVVPSDRGLSNLRLF